MNKEFFCYILIMLFVIVTCKDDLNNLTKSEKRHKFISKLEPIPEDDELTKEEINRLKKEKEEKNKREMAIFYNQLVDEDEENVNEDEGLSQKSKSKNDFGSFMFRFQLGIGGKILY
ncbi:hypothetical protein ACQ4LE_000830 [Meloidogyne hapla]